MNWLIRRAQVNIQEGQIITLNLLTDKVFLNVDNPIDQKQIRFYENKIGSGEQIEPIGVVYIRVESSILHELGCSDLEPLSSVGTAKRGDWIFVVTNGHHRAIAAKNMKASLQARIVRVM